MAPYTTTAEHLHLSVEETHLLERMCTLIKEECLQDYLAELRGATYPLHGHKYLKGRLFAYAYAYRSVFFLKNIQWIQGHMEVLNYLETVGCADFLKDWRTFVDDEEQDELPLCFTDKEEDEEGNIIFEHHDHLCTHP